MSLVKFSTKYILKSSLFLEFAEFFRIPPKQLILLGNPSFFKFPGILDFPLVNRHFLVYDKGGSDPFRQY